MKKSFFFFAFFIITLLFSCELLRENTLTDFLLEVPELENPDPLPQEDPIALPSNRVECTITSTDGKITATLYKSPKDTVTIGSGRQQTTGYSFMFNNVPIGQKFIVNISIINNNKISYQEIKEVKVTKQLQTVSLSLKKYYNIGDLICSDGSVVSPYGDLDPANQKPMAVIFKEGQKGHALGLAVKQKEDSFTSQDIDKLITQPNLFFTTGFTSTICTPTSPKKINDKINGKHEISSGGSPTSTDYPKSPIAIFKGDTDGSDNILQMGQEVMQKIGDIKDLHKQNTLKLQISELSKNGIGFFSANNMSSILEDLVTDSYIDNWYVPSIAELTQVFLNKDTINDTIQHYIDKYSYNIDTLKETTYISTSQVSGQNKEYYIFALNFTESKFEELPKNKTANFCYIRKF